MCVHKLNELLSCRSIVTSASAPLLSAIIHIFIKDME